MIQRGASVFVVCPEVSTQHVPVSQEREVLSASHTGSNSGEPGQQLTKQWGTVGIMVFSPSCRVLYANQAAYHFLALLNYRETGHATSGALPPSVANLFDQIRLALASRIMNGASKQIEARQVLVGQDQEVVLQAFGLSDRLEMQGLRVVMTMQGALTSLTIPVAM